MKKEIHLPNQIVDFNMFRQIFGLFNRVQKCQNLSNLFGFEERISLQYLNVLVFKIRNFPFDEVKTWSKIDFP